MKKYLVLFILIVLNSLISTSVFAATESLDSNNSPLIVFLILFAGSVLYAVLAHKFKKLK